MARTEKIEAQMGLIETQKKLDKLKGREAGVGESGEADNDSALPGGFLPTYFCTSFLCEVGDRAGRPGG